MMSRGRAAAAIEAEAEAAVAPLVGVRMAVPPFVATTVRGTGVPSRRAASQR